MKSTYFTEAVTFDKPMVIIPVAEYQLLLREAGYRPTPKLDKRITQARKRLRQGKAIKWDKIKHELF